MSNKQRIALIIGIWLAGISPFIYRAYSAPTFTLFGNLGPICDASTTPPTAGNYSIGSTTSRFFNIHTRYASTTGISVSALGTATTTLTSGTSTFANGIVLTSGCFLLPSGSCAGTGGGAGIATLNGLTADPQSFAVSTGQNTTLDIDSITDTHTFKLVDSMNPQWQSFMATSTTATSTIDASFSARNLTVSGYLDVSRIIATSTTQSTFRGGIGTPIGSIISFDAPTDNITIQSDDGTALQFFVNGSTEGLIINNANVATFAGNVGIGTTSPASLLSVQGNGLFSGNLTAANLTATGTISLLGLGRDMLLTTDSAGNLVASSSPVVGYLTATSTSATSTFAGGLAIETSGFVYDYSSGNVGIGTAGPGSKLDVVMAG